jgi:hypothetical protein
MLGHAVVNALSGAHAGESFAKFNDLIERGRLAHEFLFPFAFMQIKKIDGAGQSKPEQIEAHARLYADVPRRQLALYEAYLTFAAATLEHHGSPDERTESFPSNRPLSRSRRVTVVRQQYAL